MLFFVVSEYTILYKVIFYAKVKEFFTIPRSKKDIGLFNISSNVVNNHISNTVAKLVTLNIKINEVNIKSFTHNNKYVCLPKSFNTNISHQIFDYTITFVN